MRKEYTLNYHYLLGLDFWGFGVLGFTFKDPSTQSYYKAPCRD